MLAKRLENAMSSLYGAADDVNVELYYKVYRAEGGWRFRLKPKSDGKRHPWKRFPYWRTSAGAFSEGRTVCTVCWHGHRDYFRALFAREPNCRIYTALIRRAALPVRYWSADNFEDNFRRTANINIGSAYRPVRADEACRCAGIVTGHDATLNLPFKSRGVQQSQLSAECWFVQIWGTDYCKTCEYTNTDECGGKNIVKTGRNEQGHEVPLGTGQ